MARALLTEFNGHPAVALRAPDGARATVLLHGGHLVSWIPAGSAGTAIGGRFVAIPVTCDPASVSARRATALGRSSAHTMIFAKSES